MKAFRLFIGHTYLFGTLLGLGMISLGCGDDSKSTQMVVPDKPVAESQKASMDAYKAEMKSRTGKKK